MLKRVITTALVVPGLVYVLWYAPASVFLCLVVLAVILGVREFQHIGEKVGCESQGWIGWAGGASVLVGFWLDEPSYSILALVVVTGVAFASHMFRRRPLGAALLSTSSTLAAVVYVGLFMGYLVSLRGIDGQGGQVSAKLLSFFFFVIWAGDSLALLVGRAIGKHPLLPVVSPKKTVEGGVGGLAGSVMAAGLSHLWFFPELGLAHALILGVVMGVIGQVGDWCESMFKRGANVKDTAALIPGHGGILDRLDSMLFNAPLLYYYYQLFLKS